MEGCEVNIYGLQFKQCFDGLMKFFHMFRGVIYKCTTIIIIKSDLLLFIYSSLNNNNNNIVCLLIH